MKMNQRQLKNFFLNNDLQMRMISSSLIYMMVVVFVMMAFVLVPVVRQMHTAAGLDVQYSAARTFLLMTQRLVPAMAVMVVLILAHQILLSHRICGPLVNFTKTFQKIGEGDLTRKVYIRHGDYLKKECGKINEMIDRFSTSIQRIRYDNEQLVGVLEEALAHVGDLETQQKIADTLSAVRANAERTRKDLAVFKLSNGDNASR